MMGKDMNAMMADMKQRFSKNKMDEAERVKDSLERLSFGGPPGDQGGGGGGSAAATGGVGNGLDKAAARADATPLSRPRVLHSRGNGAEGDGAPSRA